LKVENQQMNIKTKAETGLRNNIILYFLQYK